MLRAAAFLLILGLGLGRGAAAADPVVLDDLEPGGSATVAAVDDGDTLTLEDGRALRLVAIAAPKLPLENVTEHDRALMKRATEYLRALVEGRRITLWFDGPHQDRYGRIVAHVLRDDGLWIQAALLRAGMAKARTTKESRALAPSLYIHEAEAREALDGLWVYRRHELKTPRTVRQFVSSEQVVRGRVLAADKVRAQVYLNFGEDWREDFTIRIPARLARSMAEDGRDPLALEGRDVRVRGWVRWRNGPLIDLDHADQLEILGQKPMEAHQAAQGIGSTRP